MEDNVRVFSTENEIKIVTDPYRSKIIDTFRNAGKPLTVKGVADIMGEVPAKVHYHVKKLLSIDVIELDHIEVINGINAKYYKIIKQRYKIQLEHDITKNSVSEYLEKTVNYLFDQIDFFKDDVNNTIASIDLDEEAQIKNDKENDFGFLSRGYLHLTKKAYEEVGAFLMELTEKYSEPVDGSKTYSYISGLIKTDKKKG